MMYKLKHLYNNKYLFFLGICTPYIGVYHSKNRHNAPCYCLENAVYDKTLNIPYPKQLALPTAPWDKETVYGCLGATTRCMHDACWVPFARAYSLAIYADQVRIAEYISGQTGKMENDNNLLFSPDINKTFVFTFLNTKSKSHIIKGFQNALYNAVEAQKLPPQLHDQFVQQLAKLIQLLSSCNFDKGTKLYLCTVQNLSGKEEGKLLVFILPPKEDTDIGNTPFKPINHGAKYVGCVTSSLLIEAYHSLYLMHPDGKPAKYPTMAKEYSSFVCNLAN